MTATMHANKISLLYAALFTPFKPIQHESGLCICDIGTPFAWKAY